MGGSPSGQPQRSERVRHAKWMLGGGAITAVVGFASNLVLVRFIEPQGFGRFAIAAATMGLVFAVCSLRLNVLIVRTPDAEFDGPTQRRFKETVFQEAVLLGALAAGSLALAGLLNAYNAVLLVTMTVGQFVTNHKALYERQMPYVRLATLDTVSRVAGHGLAVVLAASGIMQEGALYLRELAVVVIAGVWLRGLGQMGQLGVSVPSWRTWRTMLRQASLPWADGMLESLFDRCRVLAAAAVGGERGAGLFFQAYRLAVVPHQLLQPLMGRMALNWFSREPNSQLRRRRRRQLIGLGVLPLVASVGAVLAFADPVVPLVFGEPWRPVVPILVALSGFIVFNTLFSTYKMFAFAARGMRVLFVARLLQFVGLGIAMTPWALGRPMDVSMVGAGVSLAFGLAFLVAVVGFAYEERKPAVNGGKDGRAKSE